MNPKTFALPPTDMAFPRREDFVEVLLAPVFIEPMDDSGERLCAGVVAASGKETLRTGADHLLRYQCVYGSAVATLGLVADLALRSLEAHIVAVGSTELEVGAWNPPASGISLGYVRTTTASSLKAALAGALAEHAAAVAIDGHQPDRGLVGDRYASMSAVRLDREVRDAVLAARPEMNTGFGRNFRVHPTARPFALGFCGNRIVANFSTLTRKQLSAAVRMSKAKLWDLELARDGHNLGWFKGVPQSFELLVLTPSIAQSDEGEPGDSIAQAYAELKFEADRKDIISRPLSDSESIAKRLVAAEAA
jgi:hypothetical protein